MFEHSKPAERKMNTLPTLYYGSSFLLNIAVAIVIIILLFIMSILLQYRGEDSKYNK